MHLSGGPVDYILAFFGGIVASLTPCAYPLLPVSISLVGANAGSSRLKGFSLGLVYVTGIALVYSALGLFASLTGKLFGAISSHPATYIVVGLVIVVFGLSLFDLFMIRFPVLARSRLARQKGYLSAFLLGLSSGLVIGPCTTPILGAILVYLATKKSIAYGATLLLTFAYGMGLIFILASTFGGLLVNLPKSGKWLIYIKRLSAAVLIAIGIYFIFSGARRLFI
jgi:thiol:disulfide interchange protein DsbD